MNNTDVTGMKIARFTIHGFIIDESINKGSIIAKIGKPRYNDAGYGKIQNCWDIEILFHDIKILNLMDLSKYDIAFSNLNDDIIFITYKEEGIHYAPHMVFNVVKIEKIE